MGGGWRCSERGSLLTVDNYIDVFDIRCGHIIAGLAFVTTCLVPHDAYNVQVLFTVQWLRCRGEEEGKEKGGRDREGCGIRIKLLCLLHWGEVINRSA